MVVLVVELEVGLAPGVELTVGVLVCVAGLAVVVVEESLLLVDVESPVTLGRSSTKSEYGTVEHPKFHAVSSSPNTKA